MALSRYQPFGARRWAEAVLRWQSERREVFGYFDNQKAAAPHDARRLMRMIEQ
jgi:uncharacterized protein YecE (DUF72 family)